MLRRKLLMVRYIRISFFHLLSFIQLMLYLIIFINVFISALPIVIFVIPEFHLNLV